MTEAVVILYACRCGHWSPVGSMFYSELCQKLVCRQPTCSVEEFESYYCSYLLTNMPTKEANVYQNRSSRCFACVACESVLSTVFDDTQNKYFFACPHCHWDSLEVGLLEDDPDTLHMTAVARERENPHEDVFHTLLSFHTTASTANANANSYGASSSVSRSFMSSRTNSQQSLSGTMKELQRDQHMKKFHLQRIADMGSWKYEHALARVQEREKWLEAQRREHEWPELKKQLETCSEPVRNQSDESVEDLAALSDMDAVALLSQRLLVPLDQPRAAQALFPHRPLLRVKRTWRCIESIERGSAGILVKPQISPMTGDSSLPVPGAWFKKANLAVHFVPVVTFQVLPHSCDSMHAECVLLIENPLDNAIQIVCRPGEADADHAKVLLEDATPIVLGAHEDPSLVDAFSGDASTVESGTSSGAHGRNQHLVTRVRNLAKLCVPMELSSLNKGQITFRLQIEMIKLDDVDQEPIMSTLFTFKVELTAPHGPAI